MFLSFAGHKSGTVPEIFLRLKKLLTIGYGKFAAFWYWFRAGI
jgi:hypothetical protein